MTTVAPRWTRHRDRNAVVIGLIGITAVSWVYVAHQAGTMTSSAGTADSMNSMRAMAGVHAWTAGYFGLILAMWVVMMIAMMTPTAIPMTLVYAAVRRKAARQQDPVASTYVFVAGYLTVWGVFSVAAALAQWALDENALLSPTMAAKSPVLGSALLIAAGGYQFTALKNACLQQCRAPAHFLSRHWHPGVFGAYRTGLRLGTYCLGCCWVLMALLFVGGVMNLLWVAVIAAFVLLEKTLPFGPNSGRIAGVAAIAVGLLGVGGLLAID